MKNNFLKIFRYFSLFVFSLSVFSCAGSDIFQSIGNNVWNPISIAVDSRPAQKKAYLVNGNTGYMYKDASIHVLDLTNPTAPTRIGDPISVPNFSGDAYLDTTNDYLYVTNRLSSDNQDLIDDVLQVNLTTLAVTHLYDGANPFGIAIDPDNANLYVATSNGQIDYFSKTAPTPDSIQSITFTTLTLDNGAIIQTPYFRELAIIRFVQDATTYNYAFATLPTGGVLIIDVDQRAQNAASAKYFIGDFISPRGIISDGTFIYLVSVDYGPDGVTPTPYLYKLDPLKLSGAQANIVVTKAKADLYADGATPYQVGNEPQEIEISDPYIFVTNFTDNTVSVVNYAAFTQAQAAVAVGTSPFGMDVYDDGTKKYLYITNLGSNNLSVMDLSVTPLSSSIVYP